MPVALLNATKIIRTFLLAGKEYVCVMRLHGDVPRDKLEEIFSEFTGKIYQRPPLRSSVKRTVRVKTIYYLKILEIEGRYVLFRVGCEAGTYIRKLCHDIGEALGVGAHMKELRRTRVGLLKEDETLVTLHDVVDAYKFWVEEEDERWIRKVIMPMERAIGHIPKVVIKDTAVDAICNGAMLAVPGILRLESGINKGDLVAIMTQKGELVALGKALMTSKEMYKKDKGLAVKPVRVIMKRGTYPPVWKRRRISSEYRF